MKIKLAARIKSKFTPGVPHVAKGKHGKLFECKEEHTLSNQCGASIFCIGDNWTKLEQHLYFVHDINLRSGNMPQWMSKRQPAKQSSGEGTLEFWTVQQADEQKPKADELVIKWILSAGMSLSLVESPSFVRMMHALQPNYRLPSKETVITEILPRRYKEQIEFLKEVHQLTVT